MPLKIMIKWQSGEKPWSLLGSEASFILKGVTELEQLFLK